MAHFRAPYGTSTNFRPDHAGPPSRSLAREHRLDRVASLAGPILVVQCRDRPSTMVVARPVACARSALAWSSGQFDDDALTRPLIFVPARMPNDPAKVAELDLLEVNGSPPPVCCFSHCLNRPNLLTRGIGLPRAWPAAASVSDGRSASSTGSMMGFLLEAYISMCTGLRLALYSKLPR